MIIFSEIYLILTAVLFGGLWILASSKENGGFDKREGVQLLLGLLSIYVCYEFEKFGIAGLALVLGSLLISVKIDVFKFGQNDIKR